MRRHSLVLPAVALALAACAHSPQAAPRDAPAPAPSPAVTPARALDPVGVYDFSTMVDGDEVTGTITITGAAGSYGGSVSSTGRTDMSIRGVTVNGSKITVTADSDGGPAVLEFTLTGQDLAGSWTLGDMNGTLTGRKRPG